MKLPNNGGDSTQTSNFLSPNGASSPGIELQLIELLTKESHRNPQTTQALTKTISCSLQTDSKAPLLKTMPT